MPDTPPLSVRIVEVESLVTHLQRDIELLNGALLDQQRQIDALRRIIERLDERVARLAEDEEPRDLIEERPPHY